MSTVADLSTPPPLTSSERRTTLILVTALHAFTHLYPCALLPLYLLIKKDLHLSGVAPATLLVSVMSMFYCFSGLPLGRLADRVSRKKLLTVGLFFNGLAYVFISVAPNYLTVLLGLIGAGIAGGFYHPAASGLVFGLYPKSKGKAVGLAGTGAAFGFFLGPAYAGWRGQIAGWRAPCLELGLAGMVVAILFAFLAREVPIVPISSEQTHETTAAIRKILGRIVWIGVAFSLRDFGGIGVATLTSLFLQNVHDLNKSQTGFILGLMSLPAIVANPLLGVLSEGRHRLRWLTGLLVFSGVGAMLIPWMPRGGVVPLLLCYQFLLLATYPVMESAFADVIPDALRGRVSGVYFTAAGILGNFAPWTMGRVTDLLKQSAHAAPAYIPAYATLGLVTFISTVGVHLIHRLKHSSAVEVVAEERST
ncbi:MAG: MFS transporter [Armatimonadetes bacterium]|nr:MFS transporter [Armatimonadota bacterium]